MTRSEMMTLKKVRVKKEYGVWYYNKLVPDWVNGLDAPVYHLFNENKEFEMSFGCYGDMVYYIETGIIL